MTDTDIHSRGYYCDRSLCIKAQRDELREKLFAKEWVGLTDDEIEEAVDDEFAFGLQDGGVSNKTVIQYARAIEAMIKEKNYASS